MPAPTFTLVLTPAYALALLGTCYGLSTAALGLPIGCGPWEQIAGQQAPRRSRPRDLEGVEDLPGLIHALRGIGGHQA
jgi:hypothetical protein